MDKASTMTKDFNLDITKDYKWKPRDIRLPTKNIDIMLVYGSYWPMRYDYTKYLFQENLLFPSTHELSS